MNGAIINDATERADLGQIVEVIVGPLAGLRGVLIKLEEDGRATIRLEEQQGVLLVAPATAISPVFATR